MQRRQLLRACTLSLSLGAAALVSVSLSGCGFALRQPSQFAFKTVYLTLPANASMGTEMRRSLLATGQLVVPKDPSEMLKSDVVLDIFSEERQRVVVGMNASGQVREQQLRLRIKFRLRTPAGKVLIPDVELFQQRDLSYTETAALSKEIEEATMYRDMQTDIVQQIMRRLGAVRAL
jgi:LPS-assembly lipoprotein